MALQSNISSDMVVVEPGATAPLTIEVENTGQNPDQVEVGIEGVDGEWIAIPVPVVNLNPGEKQSVKIFFKPPRMSESGAGNYPFIAKVRSLNDGDVRSAQGVLTIKPYHNMTVEVNPKKGFVTPTKRQNVFTVTLMNMGNSEHMIQLTADDPEEVCAYEFDEEQITLAPGQQKDVDFLVNPKKGSPFGSTRLIGFAVTARSITVPSVVASSQAQLEIRPLITPLSATVLGVCALILTLIIITQPKKPIVHLRLVDQMRKVYRGSTFMVQWQAENATSVKLVAGGETIKENLPPEGQEEIQAALVGTLKVQAVAYRDNRVSEPGTLEVDVENPPVFPDPEILTLKPNKDTINKGEQFTLSYKFNKDVTKAILSPQNTELNLNLNSILVSAPNVGLNDFEVVAYNSAGKVVKRTFKVTVVDNSLAKVVKFECDPMEVQEGGGMVTISWQVMNANRIEFSYTGTDPKKPFIIQAVDSREIQIIGDTIFKLTAFDANGKPITKTLTVKVKKPELPPDTNNPPVDGPPTTGGDGGRKGTTTG